LRRVELSGDRSIDRFESLNASVRRLAPAAHVVVIEIGAGGRVGRHRAASQQLFTVVRGSGWVAGPDGRRVDLVAGEAVLWSLDEEHESGSEDGMTALVVEADSFDV
jgi:quercetin dioxygenase-like cupin family protein